MSYQFDKKDIFDLAKYIGADIQVKGEEVNFLYCPFCKGGEHRDKNKFFINTKTGQFICHRGSCGKKGSFYTLAKEVGFPLDFGTKEPLRKNYITSVRMARLRLIMQQSGRNMIRTA